MDWDRDILTLSFEDTQTDSEVTMTFGLVSPEEAAHIKAVWIDRLRDLHMRVTVRSNFDGDPVEVGS